MVGENHAETEVDQLDSLTLLVYQHVVQFDIPMTYVQRMKIADTLSELLEYSPRRIKSNDLI